MPVRGPYKGKKSLLTEAKRLRMEGYGYGFIGRSLGVPAGTIRHWVRGIVADRSRSVSLGLLSVRGKEIENYTSNGNRRRALIRQRGHKCERCGLTEWQGEPIPLEQHHEDGDNSNQSSVNLKLLCLNCHALTWNFRRRVLFLA